jgi:hypothetical protein
MRGTCFFRRYAENTKKDNPILQQHRTMEKGAKTGVVVMWCGQNIFPARTLDQNRGSVYIIDIESII